jgi:hypothetical protein
VRATPSAWASSLRCSRCANDDFLYVLDENPSEELREKLMEAVRSCPKNAISIED